MVDVLSSLVSSPYGHSSFTHVPRGLSKKVADNDTLTFYDEN